MTRTSERREFDFGLDYIRRHFNNDEALAIQQMTHSLYRVNPEPLISHLLMCLDLSGTESVLDVACGNGFLLRDVVSRLRHGGSAVAIDISPAMLAQAERNVGVSWVPLQFVECRAETMSQTLDRRFERVMANFLFHYIDEPDVMCAEMRKMLSDEGKALVTIEARGSLGEMYQMHFHAMEIVGFPTDFIARLPRGRRGKMTLDNAAEILSRHFDFVEERPYPDTLRFFDTAPFMRFYADGHGFCGARDKATDIMADKFTALYTEVESMVRRQIEHVGHFDLNKRNSVFVCKGLSGK